MLPSDYQNNETAVKSSGAVNKSMKLLQSSQYPFEKGLKITIQI